MSKEDSVEEPTDYAPEPTPSGNQDSALQKEIDEDE